MRQPERGDAAHGLAELFNQRAGQRGGAGDRDLLSDDRPHAELERIERPGDAQPAVLAHERGQQRVAREVAIDHLRIRVEIE